MTTPHVLPLTPSPPKPAHSRGLLHSIGFKCVLVLVFLRFSDLHEIFAFLTHLNTYVLYFFAPISLLAVIFSGGLRRIFREKTPKFWLAFAVWMLLAIPFSSWRGGSLAHVVSYIKTDLIMFLLTAGLATTWTECREIIYTIAAASVCNIGAAYFFLKSGEERLTLHWSGTIGNPNDLAAHLLLVLPFLLFIALKPHTSALFRFAVAALIIFGLFQILRTASRGGLTALVFVILFVLIRGSARQKFAVGVTAVVVLVVLIGFLPTETWTRLTSFSKGKRASEEALESAEIRQYLLKQSIIYTLKKPVFGVGPGQFSSYEGTSMTKQGLRGSWQEAHNSYTQISSECGIPALAFYLAALFSTFGLLARIRKNATEPYRKEIVTAGYCITLGLVAYSIAALFVNFGYKFQVLAVSGLVVAMWFAVVNDRRRLLSRDTRHAQTPAVTPGMEPVGSMSGI